jgi:hypothetical protein
LRKAMLILLVCLTALASTVQYRVTKKIPIPGQQQCSHGIKRRDMQNTLVAEIDDALVLICLQQCFEHRAGLRPVFREDIPFVDVNGARVG